MSAGAHGYPSPQILCQGHPRAKAGLPPHPILLLWGASAHGLGVPSDLTCPQGRPCLEQGAGETLPEYSPSSPRAPASFCTPMGCHHSRAAAPLPLTACSPQTHLLPHKAAPIPFHSDPLQNITPPPILQWLPPKPTSPFPFPHRLPQIPFTTVFPPKTHTSHLLFPLCAPQISFPIVTPPPNTPPLSLSYTVPPNSPSQKCSPVSLSLRAPSSCPPPH